MSGVVEETRVWQSRLVVVALMLSALAIVPSAVKPFMLPKATGIGAAMLVAAALAVVRWASAREVRLPLAPAAVAVGAFVLASVVATMFSVRPLDSFIGTYDRYTGLASYLSYVALLLTVLAVWDQRLLAALWKALLVALAVVVGYGVVQQLGADPFAWTNTDLGADFSTFGNVDFSAAWCGAVSVVALVTLIEGTADAHWRWLAALVLPATLWYVVSTGTSQGLVVTAIASVWALAVTWPVYADRSPASAGRLRRFTHLGPGWARFGVLLLVGVLGCVLAYPFLRAQLAQALVERPAFWTAAWRIFVDHLLLGTGLSSYADYFSAYRPTEHAVTYGDLTADVPHSVPLAMLANGGIVLGGAYLAFVFIVGWSLVRGVMRKPSTRDRVVFGAFGGVWLAYQAQSLISVDVPPLAFLHWLSAGVIIATAEPPRWASLRLPGFLPAREAEKLRRKRGVVVPLSTRIIQGGVAVVVATALWFALYPLRADLLAASSAPLVGQGKQVMAADNYLQAADLCPSEGRYAFHAARAYESAADIAAAMEAAETAARRDPGNPTYALFAGWYADRAGREVDARQWYVEAARRAPNHPETLVAVADYFARMGRSEKAQHYLERALRLEPRNSRALEIQRNLAA